MAFDPTGKHANDCEGRRGLLYHREKAKGKKSSDSDSSQGSKGKGNKGKKGSDMGKMVRNDLGLNITSGSFEEGIVGKGGKGKGGKSKEGKTLCYWAGWSPARLTSASIIWTGKSKKARTHDLCATCPKAHALQRDGSRRNHHEYYEQRGVEWHGAEADDQPFLLAQQWQHDDGQGRHSQHWQTGEQGGWQSGDKAAERPRS